MYITSGSHGTSTVGKMAARRDWTLVLAIYVALSLEEVIGSQEVMTKLTGGFAKVMEACKTEVGAGDHIMQDFYNYWRESYELVNRDMGCMLICMASKLNLLDEDMNMHHGNAQEFAKAHGADDATSKLLVDMLHECGIAHNFNDPCMMALETSKCFRTKIHDLKWAPDMEVVLEEIMTAIQT